MLSVALKGTVDWRMVVSGLVCFVLKSEEIFFSSSCIRNADFSC